MMNFPKLETCLKCIDADNGWFGDSEFVYVEHLCGVYGDCTEWKLEKRNGRESNGIDIVSCPSLVEMMKYMDEKHRYFFDDLMWRAFYYDNPAEGNYENLVNNFLVFACGEIESKENK